MEPNNTTPINNYAPSPVPAPAPEKKVGPMIAILIIVLVLIIGALYMFASRTTEPTTPYDASTMTDSTQDQQVQPVTSTSDDAASLQADLDASTNGLDNQNF